MKISFTEAEAKSFFAFAKDEFDIVRIVDPRNRRICDMDTWEETDQVCHDIWGRCERCENCTSLRCLKSKKRAYKVEFKDGRVFVIFSKYMAVGDREFVVEMVSDATDDFLADSNEKDKVAEIIKSYNHMVITDSLTGVYNRRFLDQYFAESLNCCYDKHITVNVAIMDIDDFKKVNDQYGHLAGDQMLQDVAGYWKLHYDYRRKNHDQIVVRYGGDEMVIVSCGVSYETFRTTLLDYYANMRTMCYYKDEAQIPFSLSFGTASSDEFTQGKWAWKDLLAQADKRLYEQKNKRPRRV
jgi:putative two-component system response regulator